MFLSIAGTTINQDNLLLIQPKTNSLYYSVIAVLTGVTTEREIVLVDNLSSYEMAEYIGEQIGNIIDSGEDSQITKEELEGFISEYEEMEQEMLAAEAESEEIEEIEENEGVETIENSADIETSLEQIKASIPKNNSAQVSVLDMAHYIPDLNKVTARVNTVFPESPFGSSKYIVEWSKDNSFYYRLKEFVQKENAVNCMNQFLSDIKSGQTLFDELYFEGFECSSHRLFRR